jgi:hypothetical protein
MIQLGDCGRRGDTDRKYRSFELQLIYAGVHSDSIRRAVSPTEKPHPDRGAEALDDPRRLLAASRALGGGLFEQLDHLPEPVLVGRVHADVLPKEPQIFGRGLDRRRFPQQILNGDVQCPGQIHQHFGGEVRYVAVFQHPHVALADAGRVGQLVQREP